MRVRKQQDSIEDDAEEARAKTPHKRKARYPIVPIRHFERANPCLLTLSFRAEARSAEVEKSPDNPPADIRDAAKPHADTKFVAQQNKKNGCYV